MCKFVTDCGEDCGEVENPKASACTLIRTRDGRFFTKAMQFASENHLGDPEFGNFFTAQFDDWVPQLGAILDANSSFKRRRT